MGRRRVSPVTRPNALRANRNSSLSLRSFVWQIPTVFCFVSGAAHSETQRHAERRIVVVTTFGLPWQRPLALRTTLGLSCTASGLLSGRTRSISRSRVSPRCVRSTFDCRFLSWKRKLVLLPQKRKMAAGQRHRVVF